MFNTLKELLISQTPEICDFIIRGKKTLILTKAKPSLKPPFKVYIYEKTTINHNAIVVDLNGDERTKYKKGSGKVVAEFVCDDIASYELDHRQLDDVIIFENTLADECGHAYKKVIAHSRESNPNDCLLCITSYMKLNEIKAYIGTEKVNKKFYGLHITNLKEYKEPKELNTFFKVCDQDFRTSAFDKDYCIGCVKRKGNICTNYITSPPRGWCYVRRTIQNNKERDKNGRKNINK